MQAGRETIFDGPCVAETTPFKHPPIHSLPAQVFLKVSFIHPTIALTSLVFSRSLILHSFNRLLAHPFYSIAMAQVRGTAGYHLGNQGPFAGGPARNDANTDPSPLDAIREQTSKIEDMLDALAEPVKPYVSSSASLSADGLQALRP